jgi:hypothetical protein
MRYSNGCIIVGGREWWVAMTLKPLGQWSLTYLYPTQRLGQVRNTIIYRNRATAYAKVKVTAHVDV